MTTQRPALSLVDTVSLVVGIVIGSGIFRAPPDVFANVPTAAAGLGLWLAGGLLAFLGALIYAELACAYPSNAGEFVFLSRAYGPPFGFAFAWAQFVVIRPGASIAPIAYIFATYAAHLADLGSPAKTLAVVGAIVLLTAINLLGLHPGRRTQNALTLVKVLGLTGLVLAGFSLAFRSAAQAETPLAPPAFQGSIALAMVFVFWTFSGWHEAVYVVADVRHGPRRLVPALLLSVGVVTAIYLTVNAALVVGLGFEGVRHAEAVAGDVVVRALGGSTAGGLDGTARLGRAIIDLLVMVSALGAVNGTILTGGRFFAEFGALQRGFGWLNRGQSRHGAPRVALLTQAALCLLYVALIEWGDAWRGLLARGCQALGVALPLDVSSPADGFTTLIDCTAPVFWLFFLLTACSVVVLRWRDPNRPRAFRVPGYPATVLVFAGLCLFMLYQSGVYALSRKPAEAGVVVLLLGLGWPIHRWGRGRGSAGEDAHAREDAAGA